MSFPFPLSADAISGARAVPAPVTLAPAPALDVRQLNRTIALAMRLCQTDSTGRAKMALVRLNHARRLSGAGFHAPAAGAVVLAVAAVRFGL